MALSTDQVYLVTVYDGAAFDDKMTKTRAFSTQAAARAHADEMVATLQADRRAEGEQDVAFIEAIYARIETVTLD